MGLVTIGLRFLLGALMTGAGAVKLQQRSVFRAQLAGYDLVPARALGLSATLIPTAECAVGAALLLGVLPRLAASVAALMLVGFTVAVAVNLLRHRRIECGCWGASKERPISWALVTRNLALVVAAVAVANSLPAGLALWAPDTSAAAAPEAALLMLLAAGLAAVTVRLAVVGIEVVGAARHLGDDFDQGKDEWP